MKRVFTQTDLVRVAKRENNNKRNYLVVDPLQGKHIPVSPQKTLEVFDALGEKVQKAYKNENLLVIGFAETATAIGCRIAEITKSYYMQTTRENIPDVEFLYFTESHSHAEEQRLIKDDLEKIVDSIDRIVFAEDEVTTGNTILKIVDIIKNIYPERLKFSVASILNGMSSESLENYANRGISLHWVLKTDHQSFPEIAEGFKGEGEYFKLPADNQQMEKIAFSYENPRRLSRPCDCGIILKLERAISQISLESVQNVLVIGTEEFMYPAIIAGSILENMGKAVKTHSTTRSPIAVSGEENYPLSKRFELESFYDPHRKTFIYNLDKYDLVIILTDAADCPNGLNSLVTALKYVGNENIILLQAV